MNTCKMLGTAMVGLLGYGLLWLGGPVAAEPEAAKGPLIVITSAGKEQKLKTWKFVLGTRRLSWLAAEEGDRKDGDTKEKKDADDKGDKKDAAKPRPRTAEGPEALVFREEHSTTFRDGIVTYVLMDHIRAINYDPEAQAVTVRVAGGDKEDAPVELKGTTKYVGINKLTIEAEADLGELGVAEVKFHGGVAKGGIRGLVFPAPRPAPIAAGRPAVVTPNEKGEPAPHKAVDLKPFYRLPDGTLKPLPILMFKKTLKLDVAKISKLRLLDDKDPNETEFQVTLKDGQEVALTLLRSIEVDGKKAVLEGLLGRVPAGYKLFPMHTIAEVQFDAAKEEARE
jgi:hypothetical protein